MLIPGQTAIPLLGLFDRKTEIELAAGFLYQGNKYVLASPNGNWVPIYKLDGENIEQSYQPFSLNIGYRVLQGWCYKYYPDKSGIGYTIEIPIEVIRISLEKHKLLVQNPTKISDPIKGFFTPVGQQFGWDLSTSSAVSTNRVLTRQYPSNIISLTRHDLQVLGRIIGGVIWPLGIQGGNLDLRAETLTLY